MAAIQIVKIDYSIIEYFAMINDFDNESEDYKIATIEEFKTHMTKALNTGPETKEIVWVNEPERNVKKIVKSKNYSYEYIKSVINNGLCRISGLELEKIINLNSSGSLESELGFDGLDTVEFVMELEKQLNIYIHDEVGEKWMSCSIRQIFKDTDKIANTK